MAAVMMMVMVTAMTDHGDSQLGDVEYPLERVVVVGASNVARGMINIAEHVRGYRDAPIDLVVAAGHGRSLGATSNVLWRSLPGLTECGMWDALSGRPQAENVSVIVTDVGNDLLYGQTPEVVLTWLEKCVSRLCEAKCRLIMTELPLASLSGLGRVRFWAARSLLFPTSPLEFDGFIDKCKCVNEGLLRLADEFGASICQPESSWYGIDPVHVRGRQQTRAWSQILAPLRDSVEQRSSRFSNADRSRLKRVRHARREWFGRVHTRSQPAAFLSDGSIVSMY